MRKTGFRNYLKFIYNWVYTQPKFMLYFFIFSIISPIDFCLLSEIIRQFIKAGIFVCSGWMMICRRCERRISLLVSPLINIIFLERSNFIILLLLAFKFFQFLSIFLIIVLPDVIKVWWVAFFFIICPLPNWWFLVSVYYWLLLQ